VGRPSQASCDYRQLRTKKIKTAWKARSHERTNSRCQFTAVRLDHPLRNTRSSQKTLTIRALILACAISNFTAALRSSFSRPSERDLSSPPARRHSLGLGVLRFRGLGLPAVSRASREPLRKARESSLLCRACPGESRRVAPSRSWRVRD